MSGTPRRPSVLHAHSAIVSPTTNKPVRIARIQYVPRAVAPGATPGQLQQQFQQQPQQSAVPPSPRSLQQHVSSQASAYAVAGVSSPAAAAPSYSGGPVPPSPSASARLQAESSRTGTPDEYGALLAQHLSLQQTHAATSGALAQLRADRAMLLHTSQVHAQQLAQAHALLLAAHQAERSAEQSAEAQATQHAQLAAANVALSSALQLARSEAERNAAAAAAAAPHLPAHADAAVDLSLRESALVGREAALAFCAAAAAAAGVASPSAHRAASPSVRDALSQGDTATDGDGSVAAPAMSPEHERVLEELQALRLEHTALEHEHSALRHARLGAQAAAPRRSSKSNGAGGGGDIHYPCAVDAERIAELEASVELHAQTALLLQEDNAALEERLAATRVQLASSLAETARAAGAAEELRAERMVAQRVREQLGELEHSHTAQVASLHSALEHANATLDMERQARAQKDAEAARALEQLAAQKGDLERQLSHTQQRLHKTQSKLAATESLLASTAAAAASAASASEPERKRSAEAFSALQTLYESSQAALREAQNRAAKTQTIAEKMRTQRDALAKQVELLSVGQQRDEAHSAPIAAALLAPAADAPAESDSLVSTTVHEESKSNGTSMGAPSSSSSSSLLSPFKAAVVPRRERELRAELNAANHKLGAAEKEAKFLRASLVTTEAECVTLRERLLIRLRTKAPASASKQPPQTNAQHDLHPSPPHSSRAATTAAATAAAAMTAGTGGDVADFPPLSPPLPPLFAPVLVDCATQTDAKKTHHASTTVTGLPPSDAEVATAAETAAAMHAAQQAQSRLSAAEASAASLRAELDSLRQALSELSASYDARTDELDAVQQQMAALMEAEERAREEALESLRTELDAQHRAQLAQERSLHEEALRAAHESLTTQHVALLDQTREDQTRAQVQMRAEHEEALRALRASFAAREAALLEEKDAALAGAHRGHQEALAALRSALEAAGSSDHDRISAAHEAEIESLRAEMLAQRSSAEGERVAHEGALDALHRSLDRSAADALARDHSHRATIDALQAALEQERAQFVSERSAHQEALAALETKHARELELARTAKDATNSSSSQDADATQRELDSIRAAHQAELAALQDAIEQLRTENERLASEISSAAAATGAATEDRLNAANSEIASLQSQLADALSHRRDSAPNESVEPKPAHDEAATLSTPHPSPNAAELALLLREAQDAHAQREQELMSDLRDMETDLHALQNELDQVREREQQREKEKTSADAGSQAEIQDEPIRVAPTDDSERNVAAAVDGTAEETAKDAPNARSSGDEQSVSENPAAPSQVDGVKSTASDTPIQSSSSDHPSSPAADAQPLAAAVVVEPLDPVVVAGGNGSSFNAFWPLERYELLALIETQARSIEQLLLANEQGVSAIEPVEQEEEPHQRQRGHGHGHGHTRGPSLSRLHLDLDAALQQIVSQQTELAEVRSELLLHERMAQADRAATEEAQERATQVSESARKSEKKLQVQVGALRDQLRAAESERNSLRSRVSNLATQLDTVSRESDAERSGLRSRVATLQVQLDSAQRESVMAARAAAAEINNMELRLERARDDCLRQVGDERAKELAAALEAASHRAAQEAARVQQSHAAELASLRNNLSRAQQQSQSLRDSLSSLTAQRASLESERDALARQVEQHRTSSAALTSARESALAADLASANHSIGQLHEQMLSVRNQLAASEMALGAASIAAAKVRPAEEADLVEQLKASLRDSEAARESMRTTIAARDAEASASASREDDAHQHRARLQRALDESVRERHRLEAQVDKLQAQLLRQGRPDTSGAESGPDAASASSATAVEDLEEEVQYLQQQLSGKDAEWESLLREQAAEHDAALEASQRALIALQTSLDDSQRAAVALREQVALAQTEAAAARSKEQSAAAALATLQRESARLAEEVAEQSRGERAALLDLIRVQEIELEEAAAEARGEAGSESAGAMAALLHSGGEQLAESQRLSHALVCAQAEVQRLDMYARALEQQLRSSPSSASSSSRRESFADALSPLSAGRGSFAPGSPVLSPNSARTKARVTLGDQVTAGASFESAKESANRQQQQQQQQRR